MTFPISALIQWFLPKSYLEEETTHDQLFRSRVFIGLSLAATLLTSFLCIIRLSLGWPGPSISIIALLLAPIFSFSGLLFYKYSGNLTLASNLTLFTAMFIVLIRASATGGFSGAPISWFVLIPLAGFITAGRKTGFILFSFSIVCYLIILNHNFFGFTITGHSPPLVNMVVLIILSLLIIGTIAIYEREREYSSKLIEVITKEKLDHERKLSLNTMAGGIAHEFNNPLQVISGYLKRLRRNLNLSDGDKVLDHEKANSDLDVLEQMHARITKISQLLSFFSNPRSYEGSKKYNLNNIVRLSSDEIREEVQAKNIKFYIDITDYPIELKCDPNLIKDVINNLLANAIDEVQELELKWIKLSLTKVNHSSVISITDSGNGVDPELRQKIFEPFFTTRSSHIKAGLGLCLCKGVADGHRGELFINQDSEDTEFILTLPI